MVGTTRRAISIQWCLFAFALLFFAKSLQFDFVTFDDGVHIYQNGTLAAPLWNSLKGFWKGPFQGLYIPLTYTFWKGAAEFTMVWFGEMRPFFFHLLNILTHGINCGLIFSLLLSLGVSQWMAVMGSLIFALHPIQVESVAWISSFKDLLATLFFLLAALHHVQFRKGERKIFPSLFFFILSLLSKPSAVIFPLFVALIDKGYFKIAFQKNRQILITALLSLPIILLTKMAQPDKVIEQIPPLANRLLVACDSVIFALSKILFPFFLTVNYGRTPTAVLKGPFTIIAVVAVVGIAILLWRLRHRTFVTGILFFLLALIPVSGLIPFYYQKFSTMADRFLYLPLLGMVIAITSLKLSKKWQPLFAILLCLYGVKSFSQMEMWRNNRSLIRQIIKFNSQDADIHYSYAVLLSEESQPLNHRSFYSELLRLPKEETTPEVQKQKEAQAEWHYQEAIRLNPNQVDSYNNLGILLQRQRRNKESITLFEKVLALDPNRPECWNNMGVSLAEENRIPEAIKAFQKSLELREKDANTHANLGIALEVQKEFAKAHEHYQRALGIDPKHPVARAKIKEGQ